MGKEKKFEITARCCNYSELPADIRDLIDHAKEMTRHSYAPYSKFRVGAAILLANGEIVTGSNQENAAYPSGLCAERTAAFYASSRYPGVAFRRLAIAAATDAGFQPKPISPCGGCRQSLIEYEHLYGPIETILYGEEETLIFRSVSDLLPFSFTEF